MIESDSLKTLGVISDPTYGTHPGTVQISGTDVPIGIIDSARPDFHPGLPMFKDKVLIRVEAFSCNYRDKSLILHNAIRMKTNKWPRTAHFGSEFSGVVEAAGSNVMNFQAGDRVMPNASYPDAPAAGEAPGIVTNTASQGWLVVHEAKLFEVPSWMSAEQAAGFSLAAQTAGSMVRRAELTPGETAIVASARSSTGICLIRTLLANKMHVIAVSSNTWATHEQKLIDPNGDVQFLTLDQLHEFSEHFPAAVVFDFFTDRNFDQFINLLELGGRYVTCGFKDQHPEMVEEQSTPTPFGSALASLIVGNKILIGNCIGTTKDLESSLEKADDIAVPIDSTYTVDEAEQFLDRSFNDFRKFGKVIMRYS